MSSYIKRKDRIIITAIEIINDMGFQGLTTKEICRRQEFTEGSLYRHFRSKNDIILAVLDYYSKFDKDIRETIETKGFSSKEGIKYFIEMLAEYYENYPDMTAILNTFETLRHEAGIAKKVVEIFEFRSESIIKIIEKGIQAGEFQSSIDYENLSDIILGFCSEISLKWRIRQYNFNLKERLLSTLDMVLKVY